MPPKSMNWFRRFMNGRYGGDQLSLAFLILSILLTLLGQLGRLPWLIFVSYIPLVVSLYRMFSRDIRKRSMENYKFAMLMSPIYSKYRKIMRRIKDSKTHRHLKCSNCKTTLRVPKGKGKIIITCPRCKSKFPKRT